MTRTRPGHSTLRALALLATVLGTASACGGSDGGGPGVTPERPSPPATQVVVSRPAAAPTSTAPARATDSFEHGIVICTPAHDREEASLNLLDPETGAVTARRELSVKETRLCPSVETNYKTFDASYRYMAVASSTDGNTLAGTFDGDSESVTDISGVDASDPDAYSTVMVTDGQPQILRTATPTAYWARKRSDKTLAPFTTLIASAPIDGSAPPTVITANAFNTEQDPRVSNGLVSLLPFYASPSGKSFVTDSPFAGSQYVCRAPKGPFVPVEWAITIDKDRNYPPTKNCKTVDFEYGSILGMIDDTTWIENQDSGYVIRTVSGPSAGKPLLPGSSRSVSSIRLSPDGSEVVIVAAAATEGGATVFVAPSDGSGSPRPLQLPAGFPDDPGITGYRLIDWI